MKFLRVFILLFIITNFTQIKSDEIDLFASAMYEIHKSFMPKKKIPVKVELEREAPAVNGDNGDDDGPPGPPPPPPKMEEFEEELKKPKKKKPTGTGGKKELTEEEIAELRRKREEAKIEREKKDIKLKKEREVKEKAAEKRLRKMFDAWYAGKNITTYSKNIIKDSKSLKENNLEYYTRMVNNVDDFIKKYKEGIEYKPDEFNKETLTLLEEALKNFTIKKEELKVKREKLRIEEAQKIKFNKDLRKAKSEIATEKNIEEIGLSGKISKEWIILEKDSDENIVNKLKSKKYFTIYFYKKIKSEGIQNKKQLINVLNKATEKQINDLSRMPFSGNKFIKAVRDGNVTAAEGSINKFFEKPKAKPGKSGAATVQEEFAEKLKRRREQQGQ